MQERDNKNRKKDALLLKKYVSKNFVVVHLERGYSNGVEALVGIGADKNKMYYLPFVAVADKTGKLIEHMPPKSYIPGLGKRTDNGQEFRGYRRQILFREKSL